MRDETDTGSFERAEGDIGKELGRGRRGKVDGGSVVGSGLVSELVDTLLLEELVSTELECALQKITCECWANTCEESTGTFVGDDFSETTDQAIVVYGGLELYPRLDTVGLMLVGILVLRRAAMLNAQCSMSGYAIDLHIDGSEATMGD